MKYCDGQDVRVGDVVALGQDRGGRVVCSIDDGVYTPEHPREQWAYLGKGVMIAFPSFGLIHYEEAEPDLQLISRS